MKLGNYVLGFKTKLMSGLNFIKASEVKYRILKIAGRQAKKYQKCRFGCSKDFLIPRTLLPSYKVHGCKKPVAEVAVQPEKNF